MRNVLTNVLGAREQVDVHLSERDLSPGDVMLLCSDGLHGVLDVDALREILDLATRTRRGGAGVGGCGA